MTFTIKDKQTCTNLQRAFNRSGNSFALFFVLVNSANSQKKMANLLKAELDRPVEEISLSLKSLKNTNLDEWLHTQLDASPENSLVFLYNFEKMLVNGAQASRDFLQKLNWRRSSLAAIKRPIVIWLPHFAMEQIAEYAPDFYDWYTNVYELSIEDNEQKGFQKQFTTEFESADIHPANRMSSTDKQQWLISLRVLLDENPQHNSHRAKILNDIGNLLYSLGKFNGALEHFQGSLAIRQEIGDKFGENTTLNNISGIYRARGDYETALKYLQQSLAITQEIGDKSGEGTTLNNMATTAHARGDYETALKYLQQSLAIQQEIVDKSGEGTTLNNISQIYGARGDYETALKYLQQSFAIRQKIGDKSGEGATLNNISQIYGARGDYETALKY
ncbi:MAG: DNA polymerase III subunits gamma and tau (EC, partial [uncultured Thiotrichaceae bacterium]